MHAGDPVSACFLVNGLETDCLPSRHSFDLPRTLIAHIQSRGRARHRNSDYVLFAEDKNEVDIRQLADLKLKEKEFYEHLKEGTPYPTDEPLNVPYAPDEVLHNPETGATLPLSLAVARLDLFCSRLGRDRIDATRLRDICSDSFDHASRTIKRLVHRPSLRSRGVKSSGCFDGTPGAV